MDTTKMLQILIDGQAQIRLEMKSGFKRLDDRIDGLDSKLTTRIDRLGKQLAYLEDDAPTREEHEKLEKRVTKIEQKISLS